MRSGSDPRFISRKAFRKASHGTIGSRRNVTRRPCERRPLKRIGGKTSLLLLVWLVWVWAPTQVLADAEEDARLLKAAFVYNFVKFTLWPEAAGGDRNAPMHLCTFGTDMLVQTLSRLGSEKIRGRDVEISRLEALQPAGECHVLYIADSEHNRFAQILELVDDMPVLTISQAPRFANSGGIIQLYQDADRIRFIINNDTARRAGLKLSSRLLNLADVIDSREIP